MEYKFKQIKLSDAVKLWFAEILKLNFSNFEVKSLRVKLWEKLPKDFDPDTIDNRLIRDGHLTLIGLWHVDPRNAMFDHISKIFEIIKDLIHKNPEISTVKAKEIATLACITERDAEIALKLLFELGNFFGSGGGPKEYYGFREAGFRQDNLAYEKFLRFKNLEEEMERFFISHASSSNIKKNGLATTHFLRNSDTCCKQEPTQHTWNEIQNDYDISKLTFGKKMNFVTDKHKRRIIFRDVEHAYILAKNGFSKPAVILAGGVIEELLRLYLKHKNIAAAGNTFNEYIKACEQNKLLQTGIGKLSDSAREFRNFVHLSKESTKKHSITKAAAKGAVSSIFTIANDF